ncbi:MAG: hypothetical protein CSA15_10440 [Candidatus Delongbacteria bacterium]|nr:MAG: hypothetical protein CSA15_10440 [Candidatus Delongbacteria bacterium]
MKKGIAILSSCLISCLTISTSAIADVNGKFNACEQSYMLTGLVVYKQRVDGLTMEQTKQKIMKVNRENVSKNNNVSSEDKKRFLFLYSTQLDEIAPAIYKINKAKLNTENFMKAMKKVTSKKCN